MQGRAVRSAHLAHNQEVVGSNPAPAIRASGTAPIIPIARTEPRGAQPRVGEIVRGPSLSLQLQPVEYSAQAPPADRLRKLLKEWRKCCWAREWARTPNPKTVH